MPVPKILAQHTNNTRNTLPARWIDLARDGDTQQDYATPTAAAMAFLCAAANAGLPYPDIDALLAGGQLYTDAYLTKTDGRRRSIRSAAVQARRDYDRAVQYTGDRPSVINTAEALQELAVIRAAINDTNWPGRAGTRDKTVLLALLTVAESIGTLHPTISIRTLCEDTPYRSAVTVKNALDSLTTTGWIRRDHPNTRDQPTGYSLTRGGSQREQHMPCPPVGGDVQDATPPTRLALVLGVHGATLYAHLGDLPKSRNDLHRATGYARSTCGKWLDRLSRVGLARQTPAGWIKGDTDPDLVAHEQGADLIELDRAQRHATQRQGWTEFRANRHKNDQQQPAPNNVTPITRATR